MGAGLLGVERQPPIGQAFGDQVVEAGLVDRTMPSRSRAMRAASIHHADVVAQVREARSGDEADVAGPRTLIGMGEA